MVGPTIIVSCEGCGACCRVVTAPPFRRHFDGEGEDAWERLASDHPELLRAILADQDQRRKAGGPFHGTPCLWYDDQKARCRHYELRPHACREFAMDGDDCHDARRRAGIDGKRELLRINPTPNVHETPTVPIWPLQVAMVELEEVDSTSDHAAELANEGGLSPPFVVWAHRQTRGRGQRTNRWWSDAGSLTFTLVLDPVAFGLARIHEPRLALTTAVAVVGALHDFGLAAPGLGVRWPNDIEIGGRKLGGVLPEPIETAHGRRILLGVGLNLSSRLDHAPEDVQEMATSLASIHGGILAPDLAQRLLASILGQLEWALPALTREDPALVERWRTLDLLMGQWVVVERNGARIEGLGRGIDALGALLIEGPSGLERIWAGRLLRD